MMRYTMKCLCEELQEIEEKAKRDGQLSRQDYELLKELACTKKDLLKCEKLERESEEQSYRGSYNGGSYRGSYDYDGSYDGSYRGRGRGANRDSMGRYSSPGYSRADEIEKSHDRMVERLKQIMSNTPDERTRRSLDELASEMSGM